MIIIDNGGEVCSVMATNARVCHWMVGMLAQTAEVRLVITAFGQVEASSVASTLDLAWPAHVSSSSGLGPHLEPTWPDTANALSLARSASPRSLLSIGSV